MMDSRDVGGLPVRTILTQVPSCLVQIPIMPFSIDNFHVLWRHPLRRELYALVRIGLDRNWQPVGYPNYDSLKKRFNDMLSTFSVPPAEFPIRNQDFAQLQMATHSVLVEAELTNREFYSWYWGAMDFQMSEKSLRTLLKQESLLGRFSNQYTGVPIEVNYRGNSIQNKLWIGESLCLLCLSFTCYF